jgi:GNAT superfamily N-acetyltransferase
MELACSEIPHNSGEYWDAVQIRDSVLRKPLGMEYRMEDLLAEEGSYHFACRVDGKLAGSVILRPKEDGLVQMRQFAVCEELQGRGVGRALANYAEGFARGKGFREIILHARVSVMEFYRKLGYFEEGEGFTEVGLPHILMSKQLETFATSYQ